MATQAILPRTVARRASSIGALTGPAAGALTLLCVALAVQGAASPLHVEPASPAKVEAGSAPAEPGRATGAARDKETRHPPERPREDVPRSLTMAFGGDILIHRSLWERAAAVARGQARFDFRPLLAPISASIAGADVAICHLETPLSPDDRGISSYPVFETPHQLAPAIAAAGFDGCSTASNHSLDGGTEGVRASLRWLDRAGLAHAGTARTRREARGITVYRARGATIAHLSYTWGFNGFEPDAGWRANRLTAPRVLADARRARRAGADLVVASLHWGTEYVGDPTGWQKDTAERLARAGSIDLLIGHHAHVLQPVAKIRGTWVAYGLGNLLSGMTSSLGTQAVADGAVLHVRASERDGRWRIDDVTVEPTRVEPGRWRVLSVARSLAQAWPPPALRAELRASWRRTMSAVRALGVSVRPALPPPGG